MQVIEKIYTQLSFFFNQFFQVIISLLKVLIQSKFNVNFPKTKAKQCIILGNGPSLNLSLKNHSEFFKTADKICVNSFAITSEYAILKPTYYVMHDPGLWLSDSELPNTIFNAIKAKTNWPITLLIPQKARKSKLLSVLLENKNISIVYYNYTIFKGFSNISYWFFKNNLAMPQSQNVLVASLFLSINIGYKDVFIFGADHTWHQGIHVDENNTLCIKDVHFYEDHEETKLRPFYKGLHLKETFKVHEIFNAWAKVFYGYTQIAAYAKHVNCNIYNCSEISFIDAFERKNIE